MSLMSLYLGIHPKILFAFSLVAKSLAGSPSRLCVYSIGHILPVIDSAALIISLTDVPIPVPKFIQPE